MGKFVTKAIILGLMGLSAPGAWAGIDSGGGDAAEVEFASMAQAIGNALKAKNVPLDFDLAAYLKAVETTQPSMIRHVLYQNGVEKDALNYPAEHRIEINRDHWVAMRPILKAELAFHEYLGIAGIEHDAYTVSHNLPTLLGTDEITKIAAAAAPVLHYHCTVSRAPDGRMDKAERCGEADMSSNPFTDPDHGSAYFHDCDRMALMFSKWEGLGMGMDMELAQLEDGPKETWKTRRPETWASMQLDLYSAPQSFAISLGIASGVLFTRHSDMYWASCTKN